MIIKYYTGDSIFFLCISPQQKLQQSKGEFVSPKPQLLLSWSIMKDKCPGIILWETLLDWMTLNTNKYQFQNVSLS